MLLSHFYKELKAKQSVHWHGDDENKLDVKSLMNI